MTNKIEWIIALTIATIIFIGFLFILPVTYVNASENYTITDYGQGVFSVEHDGVIHIQGKGETGKAIDEVSQGYNQYSSINENVDWVIEAQAKEAKGDFYLAAVCYRRAGDTEKMRELAYKDIDRELAKTPPYYEGILMTVNDILKDKELALEYYEKYLDQKLNSGGTDQ